MSFKVRIAKNNLHFAASHFITYSGKCEFLHGHNYGVIVELEGPLTDDSFVFDFIALKKIARNVSESLDHRFLLAMRNPHLKINHLDGHWEIGYKESHYAFPEKDVLPLPIDNVTAERLAEYIWGLMAQDLIKLDINDTYSMTIGVEESEGQAAFFSKTFSKGTAKLPGSVSST